MTVNKGRAFEDNGFNGAGQRILTALDGGAGITITPPPPPTNQLNVGSSLNPSSTAQINTLETALGHPLGILRLYDTGFPTNFSGSQAAIAGNRACVISHKPDIPSMANGSLDAQYNNILDGAPTNRRIYWTVGQHEGDAKITGGVYTLAQWQAAAVRMANMVHARNVAAWSTIVICTTNPWLGTKGYGPNDFWMPGLTDYFTIDRFNPNTNPTAANPLNPYSKFVGDAVNWMVANHIPWGVTEINAKEDYADTTMKANWMIDTAAYLFNNGAQILTYWDQAFQSDTDTNQRRLRSSAASYAAWGKVIQTYNA